MDDNSRLQSTPALFKKFIHGRPLPPEQKQTVLNVYALLREMHPEMSIGKVVALCAKLTGVGKTTIYTLKTDAKQNGKPSPARRTLFKQATGRPKRIDRYDSFTLAAFRRHVHDFYRRNEPPTLAKVLTSINEDQTLPSFQNIESLRQILMDIGFKHSRRHRNSALIDREDIQVARRQFLRSIREFRKNGRPIYYLDETWVNAGHSVGYEWKDTTIQSSHQAKSAGLTTGLQAPTGKGSRLIITHAGNEAGWVEGAEDIFVGKKSGDYHEEMDGDRFESWFVNKLIPSIAPCSIIVMDNASYHSVKLEKIPTMSWKKADMQIWLTSKGVEWQEDMIKKELVALVSGVRHLYDAYRIDTLAHQYGHTVLRLPPYHCELNPIELVWGHVKGRVAKSNRHFTLKQLQVLAAKAIADETPDMWKNSVKHVISEEERFWKLDGMTDIVFENFIITVNTGDTDSDTTSESGIEDLY